MGTNQREDSMGHKLIGTGTGRVLVPPGRCTMVLGTDSLQEAGKRLGKDGKKRKKMATTMTQGRRDGVARGKHVLEHTALEGVCHAGSKNGSSK